MNCDVNVKYGDDQRTPLHEALQYSMHKQTQEQMRQQQIQSKRTLVRNASSMRTSIEEDDFRLKTIKSPMSVASPKLGDSHNFRHREDAENDEIIKILL